MAAQLPSSTSPGRRSRPRSRPRHNGRRPEPAVSGREDYGVKEWSDHIHPLAWLEMLRQFRSRGFVTTYLSAILFLIAGIVAMLYYFPGKLPRPGPMVLLPESERLYWMAMQLPFLLIPLFGFLAARRDTVRKIMEPMLITRLSPRDVLYGKWMAMNFQVMILGCVLLPCVSLRYYKIGANPAMDTMQLVNLMLITSSLAACVLPVAFTRRYWESVVVFTGMVLFWGPFTFAYMHFQETQREISPLPAYWLTVVIGFQLYLSTQICMNVGSAQFYEGTLIERLLREKELRKREERGEMFDPAMLPPISAYLPKPSPGQQWWFD